MTKSSPASRIPTLEKSRKPPKSKLNIYELGKYAERVGKKIDMLTAEEILQFKV